MTRRIRGSLCAAVVVVATLGAVSSLSPAAQRTAVRVQPAPRMFAYYYLWWSTQHWLDKLGPTYAAATGNFTQNPLPLPAALDDGGCNPVSLYPGNQLTDVPPQLWTQDDPAVIDRDVRDAAAAGLSGFLVNWHGTGRPNQTPSSISYSRRLDSLVSAVQSVRASGVPFTLWLSYEGSS